MELTQTITKKDTTNIHKLAFKLDDFFKLDQVIKLDKIIESEEKEDEEITIKKNNEFITEKKKEQDKRQGLEGNKIHS